jgi:hypothetical protein
MKSSRWRWHLDEMFVKISGARHYLWRAVDHEGEVLESFVTSFPRLTDDSHLHCGVSLLGHET